MPSCALGAPNVKYILILLAAECYVEDEQSIDLASVVCVKSGVFAACQYRQLDAVETLNYLNQLRFCLIAHAHSTMLEIQQAIRLDRRFRVKYTKMLNLV